MHKRAKEEAAGREVWVERSIGTERQAARVKREGLRDCSETFCDVGVGDCGTDKKTGGSAGNTKIFTGCDHHRWD